MTKRTHTEWKCNECGAYGVEASRADAANRLEAHWIARHQEVPW